MTNELVDFYNLHLTAGWKEIRPLGDLDVAISQTNATEKKATLRFMRKRIIETTQGKLAKPTYPNNKEKDDISEFFEKHAPYLLQEEPAFYTLKGYEIENGISWFESTIDFPDFANEYKHVKVLVDGYFQEKITPESLVWLDKRRQQYTLKTWVELPDGQTQSVECLQGAINPRNLVIAPENILDRLFQRIGGLPLGNVFHNIYLQLTGMLLEKLPIYRCKRNGCNNIFYVNHQSREYCFGELCQAKRSAVSSKKSDNSSRDRIRKRIARAINEWLEDKEQMAAAGLMDEIPNIANIMRNQKDPAKSLGTYLSGKLMTELLREKGIEPTFKKEGNKNLYCFERIAIP